MLTARDFNYRSIIEDKDAALRIASEAATNILLGTKKGHTFNSFVNALKRQGYQVEFQD